MVELANTLRLGRRDREFESLYPDMHSCRSFGTVEANVYRCKLGICCRIIHLHKLGSIVQWIRSQTHVDVNSELEFTAMQACRTKVRFLVDPLFNC